MLFVTIALILITVFDIAIHVAIDQVEPLRIAGNSYVLVSAVAVLVVSKARSVVFAVSAAVANLVLNLIHISLNGIGGLGIALIAATTVLWLVLAVLFARAPKPVL